MTNLRLAREQIRQAQDGHLPTLDLTASTGISDTSYSRLFYTFPGPRD
ncbi:hypothetical protein KJR58_24185 [Escherichia coli]|nr:hypothetical protein [Escherichia coli]